MALYCDGETSKKIKIFFVQDGASCSKEMKNAYAICQEAKFRPTIIPEDTVEDTKELESNVVYVFEKFSGDAFQFLSDKNCLVVGPQCIISCISEVIQIPNNGSPVYNISLRGVVICSTRLPSEDKDEIKKLSGFMGAVYSENLTLAVTHLIAESISSIVTGKCGKAIENNIPIISPNWIRKSWEVTQMGSKAPEAMNYRLPPFQGMHISCSNLPQSVKKKLQHLIESNGGIYLRTLEHKKTLVLVIGEPEGKKWQFAQQWEIPCVTPSWVYESVERGCLAPSASHLLTPKPKCSTPTRLSENDSFMSSDLSVVPMSADKSNIDETNTTFASEVSTFSHHIEGRNRESAPPVENEYKKLLEEISMNEIRTAGLFLDGCKIFLSGFSPLEIEKLKKVINAGGATLFPTITDCVSHVVVGEFSLSDAKKISELNPRPAVVKLKWMIQCIKERTTVGVEPYLCLQSTSAPPASPLSHKGLKLLKSQNGVEPSLNTTPTNVSRNQVSRKLFVKASVVKPGQMTSPPQTSAVDVSALEKRALEEMNKEKEEKMRKEREKEMRLEMERKAEETRRQRELETHGSDQSKETTVNEGDESTLEPFFHGLWFEIFGYKEIAQVQESIELVGGKMVSKPSDPMPDYAIVPVEGIDMPTSAKNIVSIIFVEDCYDQGCLITTLEYYHRPLPGLLDTPKKLEGSVVTLSGFDRAERRLLEYVATKLGATVQIMFSRTNCPEKGVLKSTLLICKEKKGKKYEASVKWGIPAELASWLISLIDPEPDTPLSSTTQGATPVEEMEVVEGPTGTQPLEIETTISNQQTRKLYVPGTSEFSTSREISAPSSPTSKKSRLSNQVEPSPSYPSKSHQSSMPSEVLKKQLLAKYGGTSSDGSDMESGKSPRLNSPMAQDKHDSNEASPIRKRFRSFVESFEGGSPSEPSKKEKRNSTPISVIKKQIWTKFGGVPFEGIEQETGKLLKDGPYSEWAHDSSGSEASFAEPPQLGPASDKTGLTQATPTRKRWNNFVTSNKEFEDFEDSPAETTKQRRPSTPLHVIKKQLWVKFGGVPIEGIEPETGKLLKDGPYGTWARNSTSRENSFAEPTDKQLGDVDNVMTPKENTYLTRSRISEEGVHSGNSTTDKTEDSRLALKRNSSSRNQLCQETKEPSRELEEARRSLAQEEENQPVHLDFNPIHSSTLYEGMNSRTSEPTKRLFSPSTTTTLNETPKENVPANVMSSRLSSSSKLQGNEEPRRIQFPFRVFQLSGYTAATKEKYEGIIRLLGSGVTQSPTYDPSTTHIIIDKPVRSEKLLCCIASGKWVLHTSYLDYCYESRSLLPEEEFEWGNPSSSSRLPRLEPGSLVADLANACYKWRQRKKDMGSAAPFRDFRAVLCTSENKEASYRRFLEAGSATILPQSEILNATHVIWEPEKAKLSVSLRDLALKKIHIVPPVYLGEYLVKAPPASQYYPKPYLKICKELKSTEPQ